VVVERLEKFSWTDHVKNAEVLLRVQEERNILNKLRRRKNILISHILRRNCLLKYVTEGKHKEKLKGREEVKRRWQLLNKETRKYWKLKEEALCRILENCFGSGCGQ
jgi:hypothetical protein